VTPDERISRVRLKIERADKHIDDLKTAVRSFFDSTPYKISHKRDPDTRRLIYYIESAQPVPDIIALIVGDALHCLRDALDHLAQQLYLVGTGDTKGYRDGTSFLISKKAKDFKSTLPGKVQGMRRDAVDAIRALEPYDEGEGGKGKGADLYTLHRLNNIDKHRLILTVGSAFGSMDIGPLMATQMAKAFGKAPSVPSLFLKPADNLFPLEHGKELFIDAPDAEPNDKVTFQFDVAIHEPGLIEGRPVRETVITFRDRVSDIVNDFKPYLA
jgi:hypothetical protein